ncbi:malic enzyme protein [Chytriomyces sp. MP71]|nr:malic enzyme protein [Chytriomyces sp. MP71]
MLRNLKRPLEISQTAASDILRDPILSQGTAFTYEARIAHNLYGRVPPCVESIDHQVNRCLARLDTLERSPLEQYTYLDRIRSENANLFYKLVSGNLKKIVSIIYTPTVGLACQEFSHIYTPASAPGLFLSLADQDNLDSILRNWPGPDPEITVITDGSRILGLGDLGVNGMGIPIGKLSLYVAAGGFHPSKTLPITLDLGTNTAKHLNDPFYLGTRSQRPSDPVFYNFVDAVMAALKRRWPEMLVQFEDFSSEHAFGTLDRYRNKYFMFNDDIQVI